MNFDIVSDTIASKFVASLGVILLAALTRGLIRGVLLRQVSRAELRRRWLVNIRNAVLLAAAVALAAIWISELRTVAVSILAIATALVIASKEYLVCIGGSLLRATTNAFAIGDRIEAGGYRGDVIDTNLFTTTLLEVGPGKSFHLRTGRTIIIPNSKFIESAVINESYAKRFVVHVTSAPLAAGENWREAERILLGAAEEECAPYIEEARAHMQRLEEEHGLEGLPMTPRTFVQIPEAGKINLLLRLPAPVGKQGRVEQEVLKKFLARFGRD